MNSKTAKLLRRAADYRPGTAVAYLPPELHHMAEYPVQETYLWKNKDGTEVPRLLFKADGKTPVWAMQLNPATKTYDIATQLVEVGKPRRLKGGTPRAVYRALKKIQRKIGLEEAFKRLIDSDMLTGGLYA